MLSLRYGVIAPGIAAGFAWSFVGEDRFRRSHQLVLAGVVTWCIGGIALIMAVVPNRCRRRRPRPARAGRADHGGSRQIASPVTVPAVALNDSHWHR